MGYYIDLNKMKVSQYQEKLKLADLLPSRMILKKHIDSNFNSIKELGISNIEELLKSINTKKKIQEFSKLSNIDEKYLTILAREIKSYRQKPNRLKDFLKVPSEIIEKLEKAGIKNTQHLYPKVLTSEDRIKLAKELTIHKNEILKLAKLTDLSRIRWVNHTFAYVLLEAGYDTTEKVANADHQELYETVKQLNQEREIYKGHIGLHDMKLCVEAAQDLSFEIEY